MGKNLLFYDIEVFKYNSMVVFKNLEGQTVKIFTNDISGLENHLPAGIIEEGYKNLKSFVKDYTLVGYNNYWYDDFILYAMSMNFPQDMIKTWNDSIIQGNSKINIKRDDNLKTLDCFQQIDVSKPGLKKVEGNLGLMIKESDIDFNIDRPLTPEENLETVKYCEYDVEQTINIFKLRGDYFKTKDTIIEMIENKRLKNYAYRWNTTSIIAEIMKPKRPAPRRRLVDDEFISAVPAEVQEMWKELDNTIDFKFNTKKVSVHEFGNTIDFAWGGLHGAPKGFIKRKNVKLLDVSSMYPSIIINLNGLGDKTKRYKQIKDHRVEIKHSNPDLAGAYKLILNSTYGLFNNQYSKLKNPHLAFSICIYGQVALYVLCQRLNALNCEIININTDGVAFCSQDDSFNKIWHDWEKEFNLELELDEFDLWVQKDVNNYIALDSSGEVTLTGGDVNQYSQNNYFKNSDTRITHLALVDNLLYGVPYEETIYKNLDKPELFQYILQAGGTYKGTFDKDKNQRQKINRVFAIKDPEKSTTLYKVRKDDGYCKFPDAPEKMLVWNYDVNDLENFKDLVDIQWYYDLTVKKANRWK